MMVNHCVFASPESHRLVSISADYTMKIWDLRERREFKTASFTSSCQALDIMRNDYSFATGHKTGEIKLWSLSEGREVQKLTNLFDT